MMEAASFLATHFISPSSSANSSFSSTAHLFFSPSLSTSLSATSSLSSHGSIKASNLSKDALPYSNYAVPFENASPSSSCITRPLAEILRDLNKRVPDTALQVTTDHGVSIKHIPWYHANRMLSFYAPGWCGEVRNISYSADDKSVTVVYRVIIRGSDAEAHRESSGTVRIDQRQFGDAVLEAEAIAFQRACARFGLGLYLYHDNNIEQD